MVQELCFKCHLHIQESEWFGTDVQNDKVTRVTLNLRRPLSGYFEEVLETDRNHGDEFSN